MRAGRISVQRSCLGVRQRAAALLRERAPVAATSNRRNCACAGSKLPRKSASKSCALQSAGGANAGFTLLEVLVAVTILAMICTIVFASFSGVVNTAEVARDAAADSRFQTYIHNSFRENMASIYSDPSCMQIPYSLLGEDETGPGGPADSLEFCTSLPMPGATALPGVLRRVRYEVVQEADTEGMAAGVIDIDRATGVGGDARLMLQITESPLILEGGDDEIELDESAMEENARVRHVPVQSMNIRYYDVEEEDWVDAWDSIELSRMPWAIEISINLARSQEELQNLYGLGVDLNEDPDLRMTFPVPVGAGTLRQFIDPNHISSRAFEELEGGDLL
ncbi:MAG: prepilin-type N-terminal cleavage/methylation domain-containing protein [Candidatus Hydrogenedens sp.]|nr:prepilin-type N-terminal cleavage/methylation domain-containing protein [Candidatus Hydrogenedens sp.]